VPNDRPISESEKVERRASERDLIAQLSPNKKTQQKNEKRARRLREKLQQIKQRQPGDV
jgi:hypothetical protein